MINENDLKHLKLYSLDDAYVEKDYTKLRIKLINDYGQPIDKEHNMQLFNGLHRFLYEDSKVFHVSLSNNQIRKRAKKSTYEVMLRSNAWSQLIQDKFSTSIRLSIHPQACGCEKIGIKLLKSHDAWATPWHNVLVYMDKEPVLMKRESAERLGAKLVYENNQPSYFYKKGEQHDSNSINTIWN